MSWTPTVIEGGQEIDPAELASMARGLRSLRDAYVDAGFTPEEAMQMLCSIMPRPTAGAS